jgi:hypothetical protein
VFRKEHASASSAGTAPVTEEGCQLGNAAPYPAPGKRQADTPFLSILEQTGGREINDLSPNIYFQGPGPHIVVSRVFLY